MKRIILYLGGAILLFVGYILGGLFPLCGSNEIVNTSISKGDKYIIVVSLFSGFTAWATVIVALFLDNIKSLINKVDFMVELDSDDIKEELEEGGGVKKAKRYYNSIWIQNIGNTIAEFLVRLKF